MAAKKKKNYNLNALVRMFLREYNIPTKKDVDRLIARIDRLEQLIRLDLESNRLRRPQTKSSSGKAASDEVLSVIQEFKDGVQLTKFRRLQVSRKRSSAISSIACIKSERSNGSTVEHTSSPRDDAKIRKRKKERL